jgi:TP901 family phage tail tape measure protein
MADRSVMVRLRADIADYTSKMNQAGKATEAFAKNAEVSSKRQQDAFAKVGAGMTITGAALAVGVGAAVKSFASFDKQLSVVAAVSGSTTGEMGRLRTAAMDAGAATKFSANEAAEATSELSKVGISTADILGGALRGSLDLAAAGNLDLARAAEVGGQAMKIFKLEGDDMGRVADTLAAGANKSAADVEDLAQALQQGGQVAAQTGLNLEDTVGALSLFADNALKGSDAGTSLKTMLTRLNPSTEEASTAMEQLGLDFYDANGQFVGLEGVAGQLQSRLGNLSTEQRTAALNTIFGADAIRAASILYDQGAEGVRTYTAAVTDQGAAARQAAVMMNNLAGDYEELGGSIETALIQSGSAGNDVLRSLTQTATGTVNAFLELPEPIQEAGFGLAALSSAGLLGGGALVSLVPKIADTRRELDTLRATTALGKVSVTSMLGVLGGPWGLALTAGSLALGAFAKSHFDAKQRADDLRNSLDQQTGAITDNTRAMVAKQLQDAGVFNRARELGLSLQTVTDAALGNVPAMNELQAAHAAIRSTQEDLFYSTGGFSAQLQHQGPLLGEVANATTTARLEAEGQAASMTSLLNTVMPINAALGGQVEKQREITEATGVSASSILGMSDAQYVAAKSAEDLAQAEVNLHNQIRAGNEALFGARDSMSAYYAAVQTANETIKENGRVHGFATEKGRENERVLQDLAEGALAMAVDNFEAGKSIQSVTKDVDKARANFITMAQRMGYTEAQAATLADQMYLTRDKVAALAGTVRDMPNGATVTIKTLGVEPAVNGIGRIKTAVTDLDGRTATVTTRYVEVGPRPNGGRTTAGGLTKAEGGYISGPGTSTSDSIAAYLSNGEYVVKAAAVDKYGVDFLHEVNSMRLAGGGYVPDHVKAAFHDGGHVITQASRTADLYRFASHHAAPGFAFGGPVHAAPSVAGRTAVTGPAVVTQENHFHGATDPHRVAALALADLSWKLRSR